LLVLRCWQWCMASQPSCNVKQWGSRIWHLCSCCN
jgi:hypothetical protein